MKQAVSPAAAAVIVVVAVIVIGFVGMKMFGGAKGHSPTAPPEAQKWLNPGSTMSQAHKMGTDSGERRSGPFHQAPQ